MPWVWGILGGGLPSEMAGERDRVCPMQGGLGLREENMSDKEEAEGEEATSTTRAHASEFQCAFGSFGD